MEADVFVARLPLYGDVNSTFLAVWSFGDFYISIPLPDNSKAVFYSNAKLNTEIIFSICLHYFVSKFS